MKNTLISAIVLLLFFAIIPIQASSQIQFRVVDSDTKTPLQATVTVTYRDSTTTQLLADKQGNVSITLPSDATTATAEIIMDGYMPFVLQAQERKMALGNIHLRRAPKQLQELEVVADAVAYTAKNTIIIPSETEKNVTLILSTY